jgi:signal transduction histidine kinase
VRPHFYQTFWFSALCAGALAIAIWLLWRWRLQQILEERTRLSRELHDTAARGIVALIWQIEGAKTAAKKRCFDTLLLNLDDSSKLARESLRETRRAVRALRSEVFDYDCSLASALEKVLNKAVEGTRLRTELNVSGTPYPTGRTWEQALLRITQESLTNTLKYARAQRFEVQICYSPSEVRLQLRDDGIGFDYKPGGEITAPQESWVSGGLGLLGIEERARQLGGRIQVESSPNNGTTIRVIVPRQSPIWRWLSVLGRRRRYANS